PVLRLLKITNAGSSMVKFTGFNIATIPGDDSSGFEALELCPPTLDAGSSCTAILVFTGDSNLTATHAANFDITDSAPGSPQIIPMSANVIDPVASLSALILNFGNQTAGTTTAAKAVTLKNVGKTPLILSGLSISGEFAFVNTATACTGSTILAVGDSCTISVSFEPTSKGPMIGDVTINDNALLGTQIVVLTGNGD
ncbi:MAG TPA: choice-of-anchor D domain-containing protein, partial [Candidatus Acidoferrales bacterium]|nr:choice-of-anchor D domain-containing protein [Candidatus Acidoferrales bacterium]